MRIGSKMHIVDKFYEASLLFNSSHYTSRFAYLLSVNIKDKLEDNMKDNIVLVGYETYSEMLIYETKKILKKVFEIDCSYIIFEQKIHPEFRFFTEEMKDAYFAIIVPINSTLTTHSKVTAELKRKIKNDIEERIIVNLAVILIRDSNDKIDNLSIIEKQYWSEFDKSNRIVKTKTTTPESVYYNVLVDSKWQEPLSCIKCFPENLLDEKPIVEANNASVVPMTMIGLKEKYTNISNGSSKKSNIDLLKKHMLYGHFTRKRNHYSFYFKTGRLFQYIKKTKTKNQDFIRWMVKLKKAIDDQKDTLLSQGYNFIYDIIVAPIHTTNAAFVEEINSHVFNNAPIVIYLDSDREYRDNVKTKYSNITTLYKNIKNAKRKSVINFHFVDDTIVSGNTFYRIKSLIRSLFSNTIIEKTDEIKINLFQNIITLLNRCSKDTILNYIDDT
ncbi:hypothetical protein RBH29_15135, partial [Herbivorax sp. ANBcel31]|uniref:hypothetical protein n=1 Tax=Herbivorax sp. ANBcel31 TaxID=3069754 RepID=UPI0027B29145